LDNGGGEAVSGPSTELLRAVIATHVDAVEVARDALTPQLVKPDRESLAN
jgi:hypothetical protein